MVTAADMDHHIEEICASKKLQRQRGLVERSRKRFPPKMLLKVLKLRKGAGKAGDDPEEELGKAGEMWDLTMTLAKHVNAKAGGEGEGDEVGSDAEGKVPQLK